MSTTTVGSRAVGSQRQRLADPLSLRLLEVLGVTLVVILLVSESVRHWPQVAELALVMLPWLLVVGLADLAPVPMWESVQLMMSFPVLLASAFVFPPYIAGLISFLGTIDAREFRREIPILRGLFNRSNVAVSVAAASYIFHRMEGDVSDWPAVIVAASVSLVADVAINATAVIAGTHLLTHVDVAVLVRKVYGDSQPRAFLVAYACFGLLAVLLASVYAVGGSWGLIAFAVPLLLARQLFTHWRRAGEAAAAIVAKDRALSAVARQVADERKDERLAVAAGIHDEVLPPLYKVHLMGQVVHQDLATGRLLDLEADVPDLLRAVQAADLALRDMIRDLRHSALGSSGLLETLRLLAREAEIGSNVRVQLDLNEVGGSPLTQLLVYQLAREALANVLRHADASQATISLREESGGIRLRVSDDGRGFNPLLVDRARHFGLQLCRERVELAGGVMTVDASPGSGTALVVRLPVD